jgi:hypothetical protein
MLPLSAIATKYCNWWKSMISSYSKKVWIPYEIYIFGIPLSMI